jgi:DNA-binding NarL/FixJ family response regulator
MDTLSEREQQVLILVANGLCNGDIAKKLSISEKTVRHHITHIFAKLGVNTRAELIALAWKCGWISRP